MRMTRAALRAQESEEALRDQLALQLKNQPTNLPFADIVIHEDSDKENSTISGSEARSLESEQSDRRALTDITDETYPNTTLVESQETKQVSSKKSKKTKGKSQKNKAQEVEEEMTLTTAVAIAMDGSDSVDRQSTETSFGTSVATPTKPQGENASPKSVMRSTSMAESRPGIDADNGTPDQRLTMGTPRSSWLNHASTSKPLFFSPGPHVRSHKGSSPGRDGSEDSFVEKIRSRSPSKPQTPAKETDSFVEDITSRTPARSVSSPRVEDSVEALDALEDAMEKFAEDLTPLDPAPASSPSKAKPPTTATSPTRVATKTTAKEPQRSLSPVKSKTTATNSTSAAGKLSVKDRIKAFETKPAAGHRRAISATAVKTQFTPVTKSPIKPIHVPTKSVSVVVPKKPSHVPSKSISASDSKKPLHTPNKSSLTSESKKPLHVPSKSVDATASKKPLHASSKSVSIIAPKKPSHAPSKSLSVNASKSMVSPPQSPAKPKQNMVKKRVPSGPLSTSKPGFVPTKSTKPLTTSTFVLPGDAIAAKLKAQREERAKKEEEAAGKKKGFKARPAPVQTGGPSVVPRENKTSQARLRRISGEDKENVEPVKVAAPKVTVTAMKTRPNSAVQPNSSVRRTSPSSSSTAVQANQTVVRVASNDSTASQVSQTSTVKPGHKSKEAFDRQRMTIADAQRERREKEEAAKKARAEAAERGRLASREWAEKQKRKLIAEKEAAAAAAATSTSTASPQVVAV